MCTRPVSIRYSLKVLGARNVNQTGQPHPSCHPPPPQNPPSNGRSSSVTETSTHAACVHSDRISDYNQAACLHACGARRTFIVLAEFRLQFLLARFTAAGGGAIVLRCTGRCAVGRRRRGGISLLHVRAHFVTSEYGLDFDGCVLCANRKYGSQCERENLGS